MNRTTHFFFALALFADDTCIFISNSLLTNLEAKCNEELKNLHERCSANKIQINTDKSTYLLLSQRQKKNNPHVNLLYNNSTLTCADSTKYLGVILDNQLHFKPHVASVQTKLSRAMAIMSKLRHLFPSSPLLQLYYALFHSHLLYGLPLWENRFSSYFEKIQRLKTKLYE